MDKTQLPIETIALIEDILETCWEHFQDLKQDDTEIYVDAEDKTLSWIPDSATPKTVTEAQAIALLESWITEQIIINNKVFLYTCRDNGLISIETIPEDETDEALSCFEQHTENIFYIGYD